MADGRFVIPDVPDAVPIDAMIATLRREIASDCSKLLRSARKLDASIGRSSAFRLKYWENRIDRIIEAQQATSSLKELENLKRQCQGISRELSNFK